MRPPLLILFFALFALSALHAQNLKMVNDSLGNYGYKDRNGKLVIPYKYRLGHEFSEGLAAVYNDGKYGFIDENDKLVIPYKYTSILFNFSEGLAGVSLNDKWGYIDKKGNQVAPFLYDFTYGFDEGMASVKQGDKWGFIDRSGNLVIPCIYSEVFSFREGVVAVKRNDKWIYINKAGTQIISFEYDYTSGFHEGLAAVEPILGKGYGYINKKGEMVIPIQFKKAFAFDENGIGFVSTTNGRSAYIDKTGKIIDVNNKSTGNGKYRLQTGEIYEGDMAYGKRNGKGKNLWPSGDVYDGEWVSGRMTGRGKKVLANGNSYEGDWIEDIFDGKGKYQWADGAVYEGDWVNGNMTGKGKLKWANGMVYNGDLKDNELHGKGILTYPNGEVRNGDWVNGKFNGIVKQVPVVAGKPNYAEEAAQKALDFRNAGNYAAALTEAQKALKLNPNNFLALFARGVLYAEYGKNNAKAIAFYSKAILANSNDFRPFVFRAYALVDTMRLPEAKKDLDKAITLNAKCFDCFMLRSSLYGKEQKWAAARDEAKMALSLKPTSEKAKSNYEMYKNFADPETIDATSYVKKAEPEAVTNNSSSSNRYTRSERIDLSQIKTVKYIGYEEEQEQERRANNTQGRRRTYLSQSDMNSIIRSNSPSSSSGESGWDSWFRERDRQSNRDYKRKNGGY